MTKSRTGGAALVAALAVLWWLNASGRVRVLAVVGTTWMLCTLVLVGGLLGVEMEQKMGSAMLLGRQEQVGSLSGRIPLWSELLAYAQQRPLLGYGYESFWNAERIADVSSTQQWAIHVAHSAYIEAILGIELVGALTLVLAVAVGIRRAALGYGQAGKSEYGLLFALLIYSMLDGIFASGPVQVMFISFVVACGMVHLAFW